MRGMENRATAASAALTMTMVLKPPCRMSVSPTNGPMAVDRVWPKVK